MEDEQGNNTLMNKTVIHELMIGNMQLPLSAVGAILDPLKFAIML